MEVVLASSNHGKLHELVALLAGFDVQLRAQADCGVQAPPETGTTFVENAIIKARHAAAVSGLPALADDSGLLVDALGGAPGVHSARYAGADASDAANRARLLQAMTGVADGARTCRYVCVIVFLRHAADPLPLLAQGVWSGSLLRAPRGSGGFGYDPIFFDHASRCSAAELEPAHKNRISHRGQALAALRAQFAARDDR